MPNGEAYFLKPLDKAMEDINCYHPASTWGDLKIVLSKRHWGSYDNLKPFRAPWNLFA